eukprot:TRINITY_DN4098_c0_g2_i8.p1 TRINITY_DN4098_c0_g2~~TRINITY_DN4098_c0_g2_i8.p1  ORF type:complete len:123 (-),score=18.04 TRINITY_DN4098_c0_g2_i8:302-670(-)
MPKKSGLSRPSYTLMMLVTAAARRKEMRSQSSEMMSRFTILLPTDALILVSNTTRWNAEMMATGPPRERQSSSLQYEGQTGCEGQVRVRVRETGISSSVVVNGASMASGDEELNSADGSQQC